MGELRGFKLSDLYERVNWDDDTLNDVTSINSVLQSRSSRGMSQTSIGVSDSKDRTFSSVYGHKSLRTILLNKFDSCYFLTIFQKGPVN